LPPQQKVQQKYEIIVHETVSAPAIILKGNMEKQESEDQLLRKAS